VPWPTPLAPSSRRLLLVSHDLSLSGGPLLLAQLAESLVPAGFDVTVVAAEDGPVRDIYQAVGAAVVVRPSLGHLMVNVAPLIDLVAATDVVVANTLVNWRAVHAARAFAKPSLLWVHESSYGEGIARANPGVASALRSADHVVLPAAALAATYAEFLAGRRYSVVPYGVPLASAAVSERHRTGPVRVVHIGSVEPRKGQDLLVDALAALSSEARDEMEVLFVGRTLQPSFRETLDTAIRDMPRVRFVGEVGHDEALDYIGSADIFVLSSRDEVLPVSMLEAMARGKAVIATKVGGVAETIEHGANGLLVECGDRDALADALVSLSRDAARREALGRAARATAVHRHAMDRFVDAFVARIRQAMDAHVPAAAAHSRVTT
jgi:glycosyltransferase involved in cell wall biosynthesis